ncbi:putative UPF0481 protein [Acorus calamus]|uniref:UPF0481 protein n=1 Tax=Acorus calamus TaxID=4465 RepID=A0AAV9D2X2_ACOCL|nr:putative UPF0481 protein [Acorus calamus]
MGEKSWVVDINEKLEHMNPSEESKLWEKRSIYIVPSCVKELNDKSYKPQVVSFGPYHHGEDHLMPMEEHKQRALLQFLKRCNKRLENFVKAMEEVAGALMEAYERLDERWTDRDRFLQLMILDGCFMLEILRTFHDPSNNVYAPNDPIFSPHGMLHMVPFIKRDMLMLENQLPLLVIDRLITVESGKSEHVDQVHRHILRFYERDAAIRLAHETPVLSLHVLDTFRKSILMMIHDPKHGTPPPSDDNQSPQKDNKNDIVRSAMELNEAGVQFKASKTTSLKDISFRCGVLRLPSIVVDDTTESMLLNLMAFERRHVGVGNHITSYVFFMDNIIDSSKDVALLTSKEIIQNMLGSDKAVAELFNQISKDITLDEKDPLDVVQRKVNKYCKKKWNMWRANLIHTYFRNPWAILSLVAAIFLLALTVTQSIYTVLQYYHDDNNSPSSPLTPPPIFPPSPAPPPF